jgi:hypothetical protein
VVTALLRIGREVSSSVCFSSSVISDSRLYGTIGVVSLMVWFTAVGAVIVLGAVAGATWNQRNCGRHRQPVLRSVTCGRDANLLRLATGCRHASAVAAPSSH